jgi:putative aldouronate transport system substrate-binding protein
MATMTSIGKESKNQEKAIQLLELAQTDKELYNMLCFGLEGKHYTRVDEDYIELIPDAGYYPNIAWQLGNQFNAYLMPGQPKDVWEKTKEMNDAALLSPIAGFILDTDPIRTELSQITTVGKEYDPMGRGAEDISIYDEYVEAMRAAGIDRVREEVTRQLDAYLKQ